MARSAVRKGAAETLIEVEPHEVGFNTWNQRQEFGGPEDQRLREHILTFGQETPVWIFVVDEVDDPEVRAAYDGHKYGLIAGERRTRTIKAIGRRKLRAIVKKVASKADIIDLTVKENVLRRGLNALEEARLMKESLDARTGRTKHDLTVLFGCSMGTVTNRLLLLELIPEVQRMVVMKKIGPTAAAEIGKRRKKHQLAAASYIIEHKFNATQAAAWLRRTELADPSVRRGTRRVRKPSDHRANFLSMLRRYETGMEEFARMTPANFDAMFPNEESARNALMTILTPYGQTQTVVRRLKKRAGME